MKAEDLFKGRFFITSEEIKERLDAVRCYIFDWDGVFNNGFHPEHHNSIFSEVDSMGVNLIRFSHFLDRNDFMPMCGIITGQNNEQAAHFAEREHLDFILRGYKNKQEALDYLMKTYNLKENEIVFVFDDVLDLPIASVCGLRIQVGRDSNPYFDHYVEEHNYVDYRTHVPGNKHAVREAAELIGTVRGNIKETFEHRLAWSDKYQQYWGQRKEITPSDLKAEY